MPVKCMCGGSGYVECPVCHGEGRKCRDVCFACGGQKSVYCPDCEEGTRMKRLEEDAYPRCGLQVLAGGGKRAEEFVQWINDQQKKRNPTKLARYIRGRRLTFDLTRREFARQVGVDLVSWSNYESGLTNKHGLSKEKMEQIAVLLKDKGNPIYLEDR